MDKVYLDILKKTDLRPKKIKVDEQKEEILLERFNKSLFKVSRAGMLKKLFGKKKPAKPDQYYVDITVNQARQFIGDSLFKKAVKIGTEVALDQVRDWPENKPASKVCEYGAACIYFHKPMLMLYGGIWLEDGHQSSVSCEIPIVMKNFNVGKDGVNG